MKRTLIATAILSVSLAVPVFASDAGHPYAGLDYSFGSFSGPGQSASPGAFSLRGGYNFTDNIAVEAHVLLGGSTDKGIKIDQGVAGYVRGNLPANEWINLYGLLGYASTDVGGAVTKSNSGLSYGAGVDFTVAEHTAINVDYIQYFNVHNQTLNAVSAGVSCSF